MTSRGTVRWGWSWLCIRKFHFPPRIDSVSHGFNCIDSQCRLYSAPPPDPALPLCWHLILSCLYSGWKICKTSNIPLPQFWDNRIEPMSLMHRQKVEFITVLEDLNHTGLYHLAWVIVVLSMAGEGTESSIRINMREAN